ncbi:subtilase family protease [Pleurocapsa sp. CCALA 161]|uniref:S8 family peptidase n=1 Tax=Pleurocapsa sp. CCALA 161 TaxID=2107688 RepID=UPI000D06F32F|nr:S8 family peptidase [Pleurocapsa sp. CCALA 161]PSB07189.1 subtilase family protease [Pleurocapsa sp. CCALA 161]
MVDNSKQFTHIRLTLTKEGTAKPATGGGGKKLNPTTARNKSDRWGHGNKLKGSVNSIVADWQSSIEERKKEDKPELPDARRIILQVDPDTFDPDILKGYGIEVIGDLEDGYIIGASADLELTKLEQRIKQFIKEQKGGCSVPEIWEIFEGYQKIESILSPELLVHWDAVEDEQIYIIDIGIACIGNSIKLFDYPIKKDDETVDSYSEKLNKWRNKRDTTYEEWDNLKSQREDELIIFVEGYQGQILSIVDGDTPKFIELPDSFSCRIQISGKGLKDLVFNFPYIFEVSEPDEFAELIQSQISSQSTETTFELQPPQKDAPKVCVIDSGIQERHPLLRAAMDSQSSTCWIPGKSDQTADYVSNGGHGTRVAGAILYPGTIPRTGQQQAICWLQNARILDDKCKLIKQLFPPDLIKEIVDLYYKQYNTRIYNHSITGSVPCRTRYMSAWAAAIDELTYQNDILFIVAAGNLSLNNRVGNTRLSILDHIQANHLYPDYLLEDSCRIANPAQSFQALTVGSVASNYYNNPPLTSLADKDKPSAFSCSGLGIWDTIKPEVVEYGGDVVTDNNNIPSLNTPDAVCPELVRSTLNGGSSIACDQVGVSFSTGKVTHIAACLEAEFPDESCLLYRALIVQSARLPEWTKQSDVNLFHAIRQIGYGIPNLDRAIRNTPNRITLITRGERRIKARQAHIYQVQLPQELISQGEELEILLEITLSTKAQPRRTRRNKRRYLSTWLDWDCSKKGEASDCFLNRILKEYDAPENSEKGEGLFTWTLGKQKNHKTIKEISRSAGTIQKDWTIVKSYQLREAFCIAVVGHEGWDNNPDASVPYSLVVSFEALNASVPIYSSMVEAQIPLEVETELTV